MAARSQHVIYHDANDHVRELWWFGPGSVHDNDLSGSGLTAAGNPRSFFAASDGTQRVIYLRRDGHVHEVIWGGADPLSRRDLTSNGPAAAGDPSGYFAAPENIQYVFYRSATTVPHLYALWSGGAVPGRGDITPGEVASPSASNPSPYFVDANGTHHVIYRSQNGHVHELWWWKKGVVVTHNDLTALTGAPNALGNPAAYYFADEGVHHMFYRGVDGHVHEFRWMK